MTDQAHPTASAYAASLPRGWDAYPECQARAALLRGLRGIGVLDALPPALEAWVHRLDEVEWVPEVVHVGVVFALRDARYRPGPAGEDDFVAWVTKLNREVMPYVAGERAEDVLRRLALVWTDLHRGTTLTVLETSPGHARLETRHPPAIFPPLIRRCRRVATLSYLSRAGAVQPEWSEHEEPGGTIADITWR